MNDFFTQRDRRFLLFGLEPERVSWRGVALLAVVFFGSLLVAAVLTPPAYWLVEAWHSRTGSETAQWLLNKGVDVYFDRIRMAVIVLGLPWLMTVCHLWSWRGMGLAFDKSALRDFVKFWLLGLVLITGLAWWYDSSFTAGRGFAAVAEAAVNALLAGLILGFLEETIFRGLVLRIFYTAMRQPCLALVVTSAFYAYTHFKVPASVWSHVPPGVRWDTGFFVAYWTTCGITVDFDWAQFLTLWLLGMILGSLVLRTGSLWPAIGLHAALVTEMVFLRGQGLANTPVAALVLALILLGVIFMPGKKLRNG